MRKTSGFTLIESLVAIGLLSVALLSAYGVLLTGNKLYTRDSVMINVEQQSRNAMNRIVRDVRASSTQTITTINANSDSLTYTTPTATNAKYYLSGTDLIREYPAGTTKKVASNIGYLKFTLASSVLTVKIRADRTSYNKTVSFPLTEKVRLRNE